jgi:transposase
MASMYYIGLDVHKKTISYCVKDGSGQIHAQGTIPATRLDLDRWRKTLPEPWTAAMEATIFTGWIYDHLHPHAAALKVAHPLMLATNRDIDESLRSLLRVCRETVVRLGKTESALVRSLQRDRLLAERVERLMTIPAVGPITALTWALEVGEVQRFSSIKKAISYCGLCSAEKSSADTMQRSPLSKQRNKHLQTMLIEAAKMAPRNSPALAMIYDREKQKGNANRATLAVARKLVAYLVAVDRRQKDFLVVENQSRSAA